MYPSMGVLTFDVISESAGMSVAFVTSLVKTLELLGLETLGFATIFWRFFPFKSCKIVVRLG
jgi:hypothetical protein